MGQGGSRTGKKVGCDKHKACRREKLGGVSWCHIILTTAGHVEILDFALCFGEVLS